MSGPGSRAGGSPKKRKVVELSLSALSFWKCLEKNKSVLATQLNSSRLKNQRNL
jgi:hypothetical protein